MQKPAPRFSFQLLLGSLMLLLFLPGFIEGYRDGLMTRGLFTVILLSCLYQVAHTRRELIAGAVLALPVLLTNWFLDSFVGLTAQSLVYCSFQIVFLVYVILKIYQHLVAATKVDATVIYAAICLYLLLGLTFALLYYAASLVDPSALNLAIGALPDSVEGRSELLHELIYFSYVTQTTLGFGDLTPASDLVQALAISQALIGQIYLAVLIARLVGLQISAQR